MKEEDSKNTFLIYTRLMKNDYLIKLKVKINKTK